MKPSLPRPTIARPPLVLSGEALAFAEAVQFPSHGLVVMPEQNPKDNREICKGIVQEHQLMAAVEHLLKTHPSVWIETDMRAHMKSVPHGGDSSRHRRFGAKRFSKPALAVAGLAFR